MKYLIPPSEGKSLDNTLDCIFKDTKFPLFDSVEKILNLLKTKKSNSSIQSIYGTSLEKSFDLHNSNLNILNSPCSQAIDRYTGVVFKNIDWSSFNEKMKIFFNNNFFIFSGLFGVVTPISKIPFYKLKMNVLALYKFWNPILTKVWLKHNGF